MGGNAERPQHGRGAKGPGFAGFHPNLTPACHWPWNRHSCCWAVVAIQGASLGSRPGLFGGSLWCFGHIFRRFHGANHARRGCDGNRAVLWQGRGDVCSSFFSPGQSPSAMEDLLDVENKRMADSLASKVTRLKSLALDIDKDAEEQNRYLDGMVRTWQTGHRAFCANQGIGMRGGTAKALKGEALNQHQDCCGVLCRALKLDWLILVSPSNLGSSVILQRLQGVFSCQDSDFLSVTGLLTGSVKRFSGMARSGRDNRRLLLAVSVALILIFFILYYLVSRAGT
ncbi:BET1-like protein isoform X1 [Vidua macroura]|uniref:BET1-like protein isoform X1 n=1 Tax=Vidua macroura TaxID=187451 RepID=UPI0023A810BD|nr:BET1-like protein isoform X1 [Vidua macroura]